MGPCLELVQKILTASVTPADHCERYGVEDSPSFIRDHKGIWNLGPTFLDGVSRFVLSL